MQSLVSRRPCDDLIDFLLHPSAYQHVSLFLSLSLLVRLDMFHLIYGASNSNSIVILKRFLTSRQMCISLSFSLSMHCVWLVLSALLPVVVVSMKEWRTTIWRHQLEGSVHADGATLFLSLSLLSALIPISLPLQRRAVNWPGPFPATDRFLLFCMSRSLDILLIGRACY